MRCYVLHAFQKKTQSTAQRDIDKAKARFMELTRSGDDEGNEEVLERYASVWDSDCGYSGGGCESAGVGGVRMLKIEAIVKEGGWDFRRWRRSGVG